MDTGTPAIPRGTFDDFFRGSILTELDAIERLRVRTLSTMAAWWAGILLAASGGVYALTFVDVPNEAIFITVAVAFVALIVVPMVLYGPYRDGFKARLVAPLIRAYHGGLRYDATGKIERHEFVAANMFREHALSRYGGEDLIAGQIGATAFRFSEVLAENVRVHTNSKGQRRESSTKIFKGLLFVADFNKHFDGNTYVLPDRAQRLLGALGQSLQGMSDRYGQLVKLEDPAFERLFAVYGSDQIEPRYILSSALMQRIVEFRKRSGHTLRLAFVGDHLYVAISTNKNLFEPRLFRTIRNPAIFREFWDDIQLVAGIVEDLNLNTRIWTKA